MLLTRIRLSSLKKRSVFSILTAASIGLLPASSFSNVVGSDLQNFNPTTSGLDFVTVHSSETLKPGVVNLGLFLNYAVNTLPYFDVSPQNRLNFNDSILGLDLHGGLGLTDNWDVGVSFPQILRQAVEDQSGPRGEFAQTGSTEIRVNSKYRLFGDDSGGFALIASANFNRIENNPYVGRDGGPTFNLEAAADTTIGKVAVGANLGYRFRNPGEPFPNSIARPLGSQIIASGAASYHVASWNTKVIGEIFGSLPTENTTSYGERSLTSLELLLGAKHDLTTNLALHAGGGTGLINGNASPDWRVYTGINYTFGPLFSAIELPASAPAQPEPEQYLVLVEPETITSPPTERFRTQAILFEFDSDKMLGNFAPVLSELANHLKKGFSELIIEGHTDSIGPDSYNQKLSLRRAASLKRYLVQTHRIDASKIRTIGYGESRPIADNGNYQGRERNRRVEFVIQR